MGFHAASLHACAVTGWWVALFPSGLHPSYHVISGLSLGPMTALVVWLTENMEARPEEDQMKNCVFLKYAFPKRHTGDMSVDF